MTLLLQAILLASVICRVPLPYNEEVNASPFSHPLQDHSSSGFQSVQSVVNNDCEQDPACEALRENLLSKVAPRQLEGKREIKDIPVEEYVDAEEGSVEPFGVPEKAVPEVEPEFQSSQKEPEVAQENVIETEIIDITPKSSRFSNDYYYKAEPAAPTGMDDTADFDDFQYNNETLSEIEKTFDLVLNLVGMLLGNSRLSHSFGIYNPMPDGIKEEFVKVKSMLENFSHNFVAIMKIFKKIEKLFQKTVPQNYNTFTSFTVEDLLQFLEENILISYNSESERFFDKLMGEVNRGQNILQRLDVFLKVIERRENLKYKNVLLKCNEYKLFRSLYVIKNLITRLNMVSAQICCKKGEYGKAASITVNSVKYHYSDVCSTNEEVISILKSVTPEYSLFVPVLQFLNAKKMARQGLLFKDDVNKNIFEEILSEIQILRTKLSAEYTELDLGTPLGKTFKHAEEYSAVLFATQMSTFFLNFKRYDSADRDVLFAEKISSRIKWHLLTEFAVDETFAIVGERMMIELKRQTSFWHWIWYGITDFFAAKSKECSTAAAAQKMLELAGEIMWEGAFLDENERNILMKQTKNLHFSNFKIYYKPVVKIAVRDLLKSAEEDKALMASFIKVMGTAMLRSKL